MPYCIHCGSEVGANAAFCRSCGKKLNLSVPAQPRPAANTYAQPQPAQTAYVRPQPAANTYAQPQIQTPAMPAAPDPRFRNVTVRYRCGNGHVFDGTDEQTVCPACGGILPKGGYVQIYRMGNMMGMAVGMGIYIDEVPYGHIANKQSLRVSVPYGDHVLHMTHTATRNSNKPAFRVYPGNPCAYFKAHFSAGGFSITMEPADPSDMPQS